MSPGMKISATTRSGTMVITAVDEVTRSYMWDGATRAIELWPREARYHGSLGLYHDSLDEHWRDNHGITSCSAIEGQQHFKTADEALAWLKKREQTWCVYSDNGLAIGWYKDLQRKILYVEVWQILVGGGKPSRLPGSRNDKIVVEPVTLGHAPLVEAVARKDVNAVTKLLATGADANLKNSVDTPVLLTALRSESAPIVKALLARHADPNVRDIESDSTPLLEAIGRADIVQLLLDAGADVNAARRRGDLFVGMTPIMLAVLGSKEDIVQLLLDNGADINAKTPSGDTALAIAKKLPESEKRNRVVRKLEAAAAKK
jgi:hypothetical protein